ncbi:MAG: cadherin-like beta sandwich domain-containing protein, partial [Chloroflexi bacterium]|nr:cadherin-like beta sandwich domain-containing protein [Chloroflexota bacterium]
MRNVGVFPIDYQPPFSLSTTYYSIYGGDVNQVPHIRLTPTTRNSGATVEVGKGNSLTAVTSGEASGLIALAPGENFITVKVTAADGTTKTYTLLALMDDTPARAPAAPTNLEVDAADGQLALEWTAPSATVTGYDVHYTSAPATGNGAVANAATASGSDPATAWVAVTRSGTTASQTISSLTNGATYRVRVRATNSGGSSAWVFKSGTPRINLRWPSSTLEVAENATTVSEIRISEGGATVSSVVSGTLTYSAGSSNPASLTEDLTSGYATTFSAAANAIPMIVLAAPANDAVNEEHETFTVTLNAGTGYTVGTPSTLTVTIIDNDPPAAPPLTLTTGNGQQRASWTKPAGPVTGYQLRYKEATATDQAATTAGDPSTGWVTSTPSGTGTSADITGLTNDTTYLVQVRATDGQTQTGNGWGAWSASQSGRPELPDPNLLGLTAESSTSASGTFSALTLSPSPFAAATTTYTATVRNALTHVKLFPARNDSDATVEVGKQGETLTAVPSSGESDAIALAVGANAITVKVTAPDGSTTKTYTVTVTRGQPSTNAALSGLTATQAESASGTFSALTLDPSFAPATTAYTASVENSITYVKLRPTASDSTARVEVGKGSSLATVTSGQPSGPISLSLGANAITVKVTAEDGSTTNTYTVTVTRAMARPSGAPPAAAAGTEGALVSNTGQAQQNNVDFNNTVYGQGFTTGPYVDGYTLKSIEAILATDAGITSEDAATVRAEVWSDSNGTPGTRVAYLSARNIPTGTSGNHRVTFTPSYGITVTLAANTTYHFVIYTTGSPADLDVQLTGSASEDAGAAEGWSIADQRSEISQNIPPWAPAWTTSTGAFVQIAVKGKPVSITHWTSTLAVKDLGHLNGDGCIGQQQCSAQLSPDSSFTYGGWPYNVLAVRVVRGSLQLLLDRAPRLHPDHTRLDVGGRQFQFKDASESWGIERNEDAWRLTWHGTGLDWSDGDEVSVSLVGRNVPAPPTPAPHTGLQPVRVHYDEMRDGEPVDNFNNMRLARPKPSTIPGTFERRVQLRAYVPGTFASSDPEKGMVTTTHVMLRVRAHPASTLEWAIGNVYDVTGTFAEFPNGGFTPAIALNPASKWTYIYIRVTNGSQSATHFVAIDPPPRTYTLTPEARVAEGEEATLTLSLGSPAGAGGVSFTVSANYPDGGASADDVGEIATSVTVPEGQQSGRIIIPTVDDEEVEAAEERFTVRVAHVGEPAWAVDPEGTDTAAVTIVDNDEPPPPPAPPEGPEPWDIRVVPGDGTLTVTWNVGSRDGVEDSEIWHVLRWSQEPGVWNNPRDPRAVGKNDGLSVDPGLTSYTITDLKNGVATGVFIRSMVGHRNNMSERDGNSSEWVRTKGEHTTPVAPPNAAPTVSSAIADATIVNENGTHQVTLSGVFADADADGLTIAAVSSADSVATVSVAADYSTLTVSAQARGTATVTVTAADGRGGSVSDSFAVTVKAAPTVASAINDISGLEVDDNRSVSLSGVFSDADGDAVTVTEALSSDSAMVAVSTALDPSTSAITDLTVLAKSEGTATVKVTAQDADGNTV